MSTSTHDTPVEDSTRDEVAEAAKAWRRVELDGFDLMSPKWWDATRRLRDTVDRLPSMTAARTPTAIDNEINRRLARGGA